MTAPSARAAKTGVALEGPRGMAASRRARRARELRSEEHTSELQSRLHLVCRLLLEKKKKTSRVRPPFTPRKVTSHLVHPLLLVQSLSDQLLHPAVHLIPQCHDVTQARYIV